MAKVGMFMNPATWEFAFGVGCNVYYSRAEYSGLLLWTVPNFLIDDRFPDLHPGVKFPHRVNLIVDRPLLKHLDPLVDWIGNERPGAWDFDVMRAGTENEHVGWMVSFYFASSEAAMLFKLTFG